MISSREAPGLYIATFSATDILKRFVSWNTMLMCFIQSA